MAAIALHADPWQGCHRILGHAARALPESTRPSPPFHLGGPPPRLDAASSVHLAKWLCREARRMQDAQLGSFFEHAVGCIEAVTDLQDHPADSLREVCHGPVRIGAGRVAQMGCCATANALLNRTERAGNSLAAMARKVVLGHPRPVAFLSDLDEVLVGLEASTAVHHYSKDPSLDIHRVHYRADRGNGQAGTFVVELAGGEFGAVAKLRNRYRWFSGPLEAVVAHLPDAHFVVAAKVCAARAVAEPANIV